ncbi:MAG: HDIG domain-containing protein [Pirellulaceae bacterium]|nr:HDIG domain-containing protein [Pirellulaceae bacterium]
MTPDRQASFELMCDYTASDSLRRHMLAVETAMQAYAKKLGEDEAKWAVVGLLHDFDYEKWPEPPDHPLQGCKILKEKGYPDDVIHAIQSHVEQTGVPRVSLMDKALFACDELCGFIMAVAYVRPTGMEGMQAKSVRKKMKQKSFAASVSREDIVQGAEDFGVELNEHIDFVIQALQADATALKIEDS